MPRFDKLGIRSCSSVATAEKKFRGEPSHVRTVARRLAASLPKTMAATTRQTVAMNLWLINLPQQNHSRKLSMTF